MNSESPRSRGDVAADGVEGLTSLAKRMAGAMSGLKHGETISGYAARRDVTVSELVAEIVRATDGADAFDVIELMRQREVMALRAGFEEPMYAATATAIEIVAIAVLSRGHRLPEMPDKPDAAQRSIDLLHNAASQILSVGVFAFLAEAATSPDELSGLLAEYRGAQLSIRNKQYKPFQDRLNEELFAEWPPFEAVVGFSYAEFITVRESIESEYLDDLNRAMNVLAEVAGAWAHDKSAPQSEETIERGRAAAMDAYVTPGNRAAFTAGRIAQKSGIEKSKVETILDLFSVQFVKADAAQAVMSFLDGDNPFATAALVKVSEGQYLQLALPIGTDCFRQVIEAKLRRTPQFQPYNERRKDVSETLTVGYLETVLGVAAAHTDLHYFAPKKKYAVSDLDSTALQVTAVGDECEADALFIVGDVAICVEVKASSFSDPSKQGDLVRMRIDLNTTIGSATIQAHRLENLIEGNGGIWLADRSWLDLSDIREIRSVAVCVDDLGPLGTALDALVRASIIKDDKFPWIATLSDLSTIATVIDRPSEFLLYLRRRTEPTTSRRFRAVDEMDLFMYFFRGGLYLEPDPEAVHARYPESQPPTSSAKRRFAEQSDTIRVDTHTDPLDAWMERTDLGIDSSKPTFHSEPKVLAIVDFLAEGRKPGWLRFGADLLNLAADAQRNLAKGFERIARETQIDQRHHSLAFGFAGAWGFPILFGYTRARGVSFKDARVELETYMVAKKHQMQSDRALGLLIDDTGRFLGIRYANDQPTADADLDQLVRDMQLIPAERMARAVPPSARRATKRLSGLGKGRR